MGWRKSGFVVLRALGGGNGFPLTRDRRLSIGQSCALQGDAIYVFMVDGEWGARKYGGLAKKAAHWRLRTELTPNSPDLGFLFLRR